MVIPTPAVPRGRPTGFEIQDSAEIQVHGLVLLLLLLLLLLPARLLGGAHGAWAAPPRQIIVLLLLLLHLRQQAVQGGAVVRSAGQGLGQGMYDRAGFRQGRGAKCGAGL